MSAEFDKLVAAVAKTKDVEASAVQAFQIYADRMSKAAMDGNVEAVGKLAEELMANAQQLAAAITLNAPIEGLPAPVDTGVADPKYGTAGAPSVPTTANVAGGYVPTGTTSDTPFATSQTSGFDKPTADDTGTIKGDAPANADVPADPTKASVQDPKPMGVTNSEPAGRGAPAPGTDPTTTTGV